VLHVAPEQDAPGINTAPPKGSKGTKGNTAPSAAAGHTVVPNTTTKPPAGSNGTKGGNQQQQQPQSQPQHVFADPFGIDRPRLRLRAGAGEKLKGFFLPFSLGTSHATLVLKDAECGEFCYGLVGVAGPPGACLEHKAIVSHEGGVQVGVGSGFMVLVVGFEGPG